MEIIIEGEIFYLQKYGGISRLFREIIPRMCLSDQITIKIIKRDNSDVFLEKPNNLEEFYISYPNNKKVPNRIRRVLYEARKFLAVQQIIKPSKKTIWHSTYYTSVWNWKGPIVVTVHDMIYERFPEYFNSSWDARFIEQKKKCIEQADKIICVSETTKKDLEFFYGQNFQINVVPNGFSPIFRKLGSEVSNLFTGVSLKKPIILYVGSREKYKNFRIVLDAYHYWKYRDNVDLIVVGAAWTNEETAILCDYGLNNKIILFDKCNDNELCHLYNLAAVFIYPSLYEGFGIPLLESMACGCPIIASKIESTIEVANDCPYYFNPYEVDDLRQTLSKVIENNNTSRIAKGFEIAARYSWDRTARETLNVYKSLV